MTIFRFLFAINRWLRDLRAIQNGRIGRRIYNRGVSRGLRAIGRRLYR